MNSFVVTPKYPLGSFVEFQVKENEIEIGQVVSIHAHRSMHQIEGYYSATYEVDPFPGMEHDDQVRIPECHVKDLPRILGPSRS